MWQRFIKAKIERTKKIEEEKRKLDAVEFNKMYAWRQSIKKLLNEQIESEEDSFRKLFPEPFGVGDVLILNRYSIDYDSSNGWDSGGLGLLSCIDRKEKKSPVIVKVTSVDVSYSFVSEMIERFINNTESDDYLKHWVDNNLLIKRFKNWYINYSRLTIPNHFGLYWDIKFETNITFKPKWGLNSNSFHLLYSDAGKLTESLWIEESSIEEEIRELENKRKALETRKRKIDEEYRGYKYV